jgi:hypothetical protein
MKKKRPVERCLEERAPALLHGFWVFLLADLPDECMKCLDDIDPLFCRCFQQRNSVRLSLKKRQGKESEEELGQDDGAYEVLAFLGRDMVVAGGKIFLVGTYDDRNLFLFLHCQDSLAELFDLREGRLRIHCIDEEEPVAGENVLKSAKKKKKKKREDVNRRPGPALQKTLPAQRYQECQDSMSFHQWLFAYGTDPLNKKMNKKKQVNDGRSRELNRWLGRIQRRTFSGVEFAMRQSKRAAEKKQIKNRRNRV